MSIPDLLVAGSLTLDNVRVAQRDLWPPQPRRPSQAISPDASDIQASWVGRIGAAQLAAMPVSSHMSLAPALQPARVQLDSPWYDERRSDDALHHRLLV